jgi:hypothetical protein
MKVFDLRCVHTHAFEGWFGSAEDFDAQLERGLVRCPHCDSPDVLRVPAAARLNLMDARVDSASSTPRSITPASGVGSPDWLLAFRNLVQASEDVGERFAEQARRIHYGEEAERSIRGVATRAEREALEDEGIEVLAIPATILRKEPLQ